MTGTMSQVVARANGHIDDRVRAATIGVFTGIRKDTPVDTGRARGNWQCTIGAPFGGENANGSDEQIQQTIPRRAGSVVYLTNNVPYIQKLEYDGHSSKAPTGMVRINVARFERLLNGTG